MKNKLPSEAEELAQIAIRSTITAAIPFAGSLVADLYTALTGPTELRKRAWCEEVEALLSELRELHNRKPADLVADPAFVSALYGASAAAVASHQKEKHQMLRNFLFAVGSTTTHDEEMEHAQLRLLGDLSTSHVELLRFIRDHQGAMLEFKSLEQVYAQYQKANGRLNRAPFRWILADLANRMLVHFSDLGDLNEYASMHSVLAREDSSIRPIQILPLGITFLSFLCSKP